MKEVEILVQVFDNKEKVMDKLKQFSHKGNKETLDIYYYDPLRENLQITNSTYPTEWFRIRKKQDKIFLTYKKDQFKENIWLYSDEDEISDFSIGKSIINNLGFKELIKIDNLKHTFEHNNYEIVFEEVKELGLFLEVEQIQVLDNESVEEIKEEIRQFINKLKLNVIEINMGKPELMLKKKLKNPNLS